MPRTARRPKGKEHKLPLHSMVTSVQSLSRGGSLSLPLLEGLSRRSGESDVIVYELFSQWRAAIRIAHATAFLWKRYRNRHGKKEHQKKHQREKEAAVSALPHPKKRRRGGKRSRETHPIELEVPPIGEKVKNEETLSSTKSILFHKSSHLFLPLKHWLLHSLISASLPERRFACRILAQGCPLDGSSKWTCIELLCSVIYNEKIHLSQESSDIVACIALLKHIVVNVLSSNERIAFCFSPVTGVSIVCDTLWKLSLEARTCDEQASATLRICYCFVDFLHSIVLNGTSESVKQIHQFIWSPSSGEQDGSHPWKGNSCRKHSPLTCLVATYHLWSDLPKNRSMRSYAGLLKRLIDPSVLPDTYSLSGESKVEPNIAADHTNRLSATFTMMKNNSNVNNSKKGDSSETTGHLGNLESPKAPAVPAMLESPPENRSIMESFSRLVGSLYGSSREGRVQNADRDGDTNNEPHTMNETDDEDVDDDEEEDEAKDNDEAGKDDELAEMQVDETERHEEDGDDAEQDSSEEEINQDEDEEIESEDDDEGDDIVEVGYDEDDDEDDDIMIHDDDLPEIEEGLLEIQRDLARREKLTSVLSRGVAQPSIGFKERSQVFLQSAMKVLMIQHPNNLKSSSPTLPPLSLAAESSLLSSVLDIVKPEKKPYDAKICLRRAPTQEEFFRGSLSKNPVSLSMLNHRGSGNQNEPTVGDLRQYIANQLQMADSAFLLELLIANKILDVDLKLRVVNQTLWKDHCILLSNSSTGSTLSSLLGGGRESRAFSSSSGISLMLSSSFARARSSSSSSALTRTDSLDILPPMLITYRLIGVDGEATEDTVTSLNDPEAPSESSSPKEMEELMERQYGNTKVLMQGRGTICLLRSVERDVSNTLRKIRRDDVEWTGNHTRDNFHNSMYAGLSLILCCVKLPSNRRLLLNSQAPTTLLRLLLDVLHALETRKEGNGSQSNRTAKGLQELIEVLASDISRISEGGSDAGNKEDEGNIEDEALTLRLLIEGIEASSLSPPLRNIIAKLLPYLTYGKSKLSKELASEFMKHVDTKKIGDYESEEDMVGGSVLMDTFIHASSSLPANEVCDALRSELVSCGFVERIVHFILQHSPTDPPHWSAALWPTGSHLTKQKQKMLNAQWIEYSKMLGLKSCFDILVGLSKRHQETQMLIGNFSHGKKKFLLLCHWLEATSDSATVSIKKLALLAETLLDHLVECDTTVSDQIRVFRMTTRNRKKEIAKERRNHALKRMTKFSITPQSITASNETRLAGQGTSNVVRDTASSLLSPVLGLFNSPIGQTHSSESNLTSSSIGNKKKLLGNESSKPSWMEEMENLEDESGLVCSVCQEGVNSQPDSLLGLYCYVKRVTLPSADSRLNIDGTTLLTILPSKLPVSLEDRTLTVQWYQSGKAAGDDLKEVAKASILNRRRDSSYTTTVSALNAIHVTCHAKARQADRSHPKAPKSEWEGATLRNSRVNCNVILPLVSARSSKVPLGIIEQSLTEHQVAIANLLGARPKSNLWTVLHDVRLLLLRMAYGEALNTDCGGGSLLSNLQLLFYQFSMAKTFESEAQVDSPASSVHARALSSGFLAACDIVSAEDYNAVCAPSLIRAIADSSVMAALTCILFHNNKDDYSLGSESTHTHLNRWVGSKELFLRGLLYCAGCRHALGIYDSGCLSGRNSSAKQAKSAAFVEWDSNQDTSCPAASSLATRSGRCEKSDRATVEDFANVIRPFVIMYAIMDQLSSDFSPDLDDEAIEESANRLSQTIQSCYRSKNIYDLFQRADVTLSESEIMKELQRGMTSA
ncbi:E3 ubiquitin-protein ligase UBR4-domain containing protein [Nitzschia inconspicua]|uniref:E3 ubiquitin-protein ligase UBR4-domain containing protein n=1 Tax=Nitzschia inconspicua TaxID=303405 RepID=A0A9K3LRZ6_9STRA|nr:E3 ubiquitin-protein ligase UBR4-domain containing protein [Nitzschia inconspicua]